MWCPWLWVPANGPYIVSINSLVTTYLSGGSDTNNIPNIPLAVESECDMDVCMRVWKYGVCILDCC